MKVVALIPARGGSKGIPKKNLAVLGGQPLVCWATATALACDEIAFTCVNTDDAEIADITGVIPGVSVLHREAALAQDHTLADEVILDAIPRLREEIGEDDFVIVLMQPTSPFRTADQVQEAYQLYQRQECDMVMSVTLMSSSPFKAYTLGNSGYLGALIDKDAPFGRRQDQPSVFLPNGAIYIFNTADFMKSSQLPREKILPYLMDEYSSIDIDTMIDLENAEEMLRKQQ